MDAQLKVMVGDLLLEDAEALISALVVTRAEKLSSAMKKSSPKGVLKAYSKYAKALWALTELRTLKRFHSGENDEKEKLNRFVEAVDGVTQKILKEEHDVSINKKTTDARNEEHKKAPKPEKKEVLKKGPQNAPKKKTEKESKE